MIRFSLILLSLFILILFCQRVLARLKIFQLKNKIRKNPLIGVKQLDNSYYYKEKCYNVGYLINGLPSDIKTIKWLFLKRRLTFFEKKIQDIKRSINKFFLYQRWAILFRPQLVIILLVSLIVFYFGIREHSLKRIERFKWIASQITGISPESIKYTGGGWFDISGGRTLPDRETDPVTISFNPLGWLFFQDAANITRWNRELNKYVTYSVTVDDNSGEVWLGKKRDKIQSKGLVKKRTHVYGTIQADKIIWDEPAGSLQVLGHDIRVEDGKLKFVDE